MKVLVFAAVALLAVLGLASAQYGGYGYGGAQQSSGLGSYMGIGALLFLFFIVLLLNNQTKSVPLYYNGTSLGVNVNVAGK